MLTTENTAAAMASLNYYNGIGSSANTVCTTNTAFTMGGIQVTISLPKVTNATTTQQKINTIYDILKPLAS